MAVPNAGEHDDSTPPQRQPERPVWVALTPEQAARRRRRNIAIGLTVGFLALLFYVVTIVKLGPAALNRPL